MTHGVKIPSQAHNEPENFMKPVLAALISALLACPVFAAEPACLATATEKKLSGAAKSGFIKKCVRDRCDVAAAEKKLAGAAKTSFTNKCLADGLQPYCAEQAAAKKLAGAAKNSFMSKCQSGD
jgi:hypothetical protein